jgi:hypothetical protein
MPKPKSAEIIWARKTLRNTQLIFNLPNEGWCLFMHIKISFREREQQCEPAMLTCSPYLCVYAVCMYCTVVSILRI